MINMKIKGSITIVDEHDVQKEEDTSTVSGFIKSKSFPSVKRMYDIENSYPEGFLRNIPTFEDVDVLSVDDIQELLKKIKAGEIIDE